MELTEPYKLPDTGVINQIIAEIPEHLMKKAEAVIQEHRDGARSPDAIVAEVYLALNLSPKFEYSEKSL